MFPYNTYFLGAYISLKAVKASLISLLWRNSVSKFSCNTENKGWNRIDTVKPVWHLCNMCDLFHDAIQHWILFPFDLNICFMFQNKQNSQMVNYFRFSSN